MTESASSFILFLFFSLSLYLIFYSRHHPSISLKDYSSNELRKSSQKQNKKTRRTQYTERERENKEECV